MRENIIETNIFTIRCKIFPLRAKCFEINKTFL